MNEKELENAYRKCVEEVIKYCEECYENCPDDDGKAIYQIELNNFKSIRDGFLFFNGEPYRAMSICEYAEKINIANEWIDAKHKYALSVAILRIRDGYDVNIKVTICENLINFMNECENKYIKPLEDEQV